MTDVADTVEVRASTPADEPFAAVAAGLIEEASRTADIARREVDFLAAKIRDGKAALALRPGADGEPELVGFGYWSDWEGGKYLSHSGMVVVPELRGHHLGRRIKAILFETSRARHPNATLMSLTTSPAVRAYNEALGFVPCALEDLTDDPAFWEGCKACRNYEETRAKGLRCCCDAMMLAPGAGPAPASDTENGDTES